MNIASRLKEAPDGCDDYIDYLNEVLNGVIRLDDGAAVFLEAFLFFERNEDADLGMPGPLVQFLEQFYPAYVEHLSASVMRKPTFHTVWMVNRILNSSVDDTDRSRFIALLEAASENPAASAVAKKIAMDLLRDRSM
jgi:hypothetical protein